MMDIDEQESTQQQTSSSSQPASKSSIVLVDEARPFDLESYISNYSGRTLIDRLIHIVSVCPSVAVEAFNLAVQHIQKSRDPSLYRSLCHAYEQVSSYHDVNLPDISELPVISSAWAEEIVKRNHAERIKLEAELKNYSNNMIKESIRMGHRDLASFYRSIGDHPAALKHWTKSREFCTTSQHVLDGCLSILELLIEQRNYSHLPTYVFKAEAAFEALFSNTGKGDNSTGNNRKGGPASALIPDREIIQSKLDFATALAQLGQSNYERAAYHFLRLGSGTGNAGGLGDWFGKLVSPGDIAIYGSLCALASLSRSAFKAQVLENLSFGVYIEQEPYVREMIEAYMASNFKNVLEILSRQNTRHTIDIHLFPHITALNSLTRTRLVSLYFAPFSSIKLDRMAQAFGWSVAETEEYVVGLVRNRDISGRVDSRGKVLQVKKVDLRAELFARAIKAGVEMAKANKKLLYRMKLQQAELVIKAPKMNTQTTSPEYILEG